MSDQKITKTRQEVRLTLADGSDVAGEVFLSLYDVRGQKPQRVGNLLNDSEDAFVPVKTAGGTVHINTANIVMAATPAVDEGDELMMLGKKYRVQVTTLHGKTVEGDIFVDLPQDRSRVSDYLNRPDRFYRLFVSEHIVYIGARFVISVRD
ncbi:hypothetical protein [Desulfuromonas sp. CSMB_57]|uniref:hypothetical protein n=1 Tax=Desulfuromonas sp. CSMB_57 TaxID=2807629 RepID=UPI0020BEEFB2|nr:hypothetical protein [Desulfuromonas sp. CSMB_57]